MLKVKKVVIGAAIATMLVPNLIIPSYVQATSSQINSQKIATLSDLEGHWAKENIMYLVNLNAINGYEDATFKPNNTISNAEFLSISIKTMLKGEVTQSEQGQHWASGIYQTAIEKGIINPEEIQGTEEEFSTPMTREDMALILVRINEKVQGYEEVEVENVKEAILDYTNISKNRAYFVTQAYKKGLLNGKENGFDPKGNLTRAEAATAVKNLLEYKGGVIEITKPTPEALQTREEKGIALAKKYLAEYPTMQTKVDHGLMFGGEGYTCEDAADFAQEFWEAFGNYDKDHLDDWLDGVSPYVAPKTVKDLKKIGDRIIKAGESSEVVVFVDASKVDLTGGRFTVPAVMYGLDDGGIMKLTVTIGGHDNIKGLADKHINIGRYKLIKVDDIDKHIK